MHQKNSLSKANNLTNKNALIFQRSIFLLSLNKTSFHNQNFKQ